MGGRKSAQRRKPKRINNRVEIESRDEQNKSSDRRDGAAGQEKVVVVTIAERGFVLKPRVLVAKLGGGFHKQRRVCIAHSEAVIGGRGSASWLARPGSGVPHSHICLSLGDLAELYS